ncbi:NYN domain-containing protein [uncultured Selenomonas sp.]|uniref:NYN domain-containing protein n=1 Tax=uncultured Selenomonas sp. TaxID=159275 RepID=UPI0025CCBD0B|nr:NYN domain-containing protein [uncultured Selenomonas sp.]
MTFDSSNDTVAILYDIENAPFEMLDYTLGIARRFQPCRIIVVTDWDKVPEDQKRWERLRRRPGFTFRPVTRTYLGKNSLDNALYDSALVLYKDGVRRYFIITTDSDFVKIAEALNSGDKSYIIGVGTKQASETLRSAYDEFFCYPPEKPEKKTRKAKAEKAADKQEKTAKGKTAKNVKNAKSEAKGEPKAATNAKAGKGAKAAKAEKPAKATKTAKTAKATKEAKAEELAKAAETAVSEVQKAAKTTKATKETKGRKNAKAEKVAAAKPEKVAKQEKPAKAADTKAEAPAKAAPADALTVRLPRTLQRDLERRKEEEGVSMDELVTYLLMRGITQ